MVEQILDILAGHTGKLRKDVVAGMEAAADDLQFERAAELRDVLERLLGTLSPLTERFAPTDVLLRKLLNAKLLHYDIRVTVGVIGVAGSGSQVHRGAERHVLLVGRDRQGRGSVAGKRT